MMLPKLSFGYLTKAVLLCMLVSLTACASTKQTATKPVVDSKKVEAKKDAKKTVKKKADTKTVEAASLDQRPSENIYNVQGKITRTGEVYLLRGLANVFSRGMDTLGVKMVKKGIDARVYNHAAWPELAKNILARAKKKQVSYPIVIMGHSLGGNAAAQMAKFLGENGVKVQYVVTFDPTITTYVGKNVNRVINFYLPSDDNRNVVKKTSGFKGVIKNVNVRGTRNMKHTTVDKDPKFHEAVINRTLKYTKRRRKARG